MYSGSKKIVNDRGIRQKTPDRTDKDAKEICGEGKKKALPKPGSACQKSPIVSSPCDVISAGHAESCWAGRPKS
jgi:hypothetical protein